MSFKKSILSVSKNKDIWRRNIKKFPDSVRMRGPVGIVRESLECLCKMPLESVVIGRYVALGDNEKSRMKRIKVICKELTTLWKKLNFPILSEQSVKRKVETVIRKYDSFLKRPTGSVSVVFGALLDVTKVDGEWLCSEDKTFYETQIETKGRIGYTTMKLASDKTIHPSKRRKISMDTNSPSLTKEEVFYSSSDASSESNNSQLSDSEIESVDVESTSSKCSTRSAVKQYHSTSSSVNLVRYGRLSTRRAAAVCQSLSADGILLPTPSQSGIYKAIYRDARKLKLHFQETLQNEQWSLHFDGKVINNKEHQVVVLKNEAKEIRLSVLVFENSKSETIASGLTDILTNFSLWSAIKMIVCDTTNVNTGSKNGIVVRLQRQFKQHGFSSPIYIGCQHHILDRILKHVLDTFFPDVTVSPNLHYPFVSEILTNYETLKKNFANNKSLDNTAILEQPQGWRDDMKFLFHLTRVYRHYKKYMKMPTVSFGPLPGLSNARWNSRAIFALLSYVLVPNSRNNLEEICNFITGSWCDIWFSNQIFDDQHYFLLRDAVQPFSKAARCFQTHWSQNPSPLNTERSNRCAERAIKILQDISPYAHSAEKLNLRFMLTNSQM